jgi:hypothetical protein
VIQLAEAKKKDVKPSLRDKMAAAFAEMQSERRKAIDREPVKDYGCQKG